MNAQNLYDFAVASARMHARAMPVEPPAADLLADGVRQALRVVPLLVQAANAATSREELEHQREVVEQLIEDIRHGLYSVLAVHGDLLSVRFPRFPEGA